MSNLNTVAIAPMFPSVNPTSETAFADASGAKRSILTPFNIGAFDGRLFRLRAVMRVTGGTTNNFTPALRWDSNVNTNLTTFTGDTALTAITAYATNSQVGIFVIQAEMLWDSVSQLLTGYFFTLSRQVGYTSPILLSNVPITVANSNRLRFFVTGFFSVSDPGNLAVLTDFSLDQL